MKARMAAALVLTAATLVFSVVAWVAFWNHDLLVLIVGIVGGVATSGTALWVLRER